MARGFDKYRVAVLEEKLKEVLRQFNIDNDVVVSLGSLRYSSEVISARLEVREMGDGANPHLEAEANEFIRLGSTFGFDPTDLNRDFFLNGKTFTILGLKVRNYKLPVVVKDGRGRRFKMSAPTVLRGLKIQAQITNS